MQGSLGECKSFDKAFIMCELALARSQARDDVRWENDLL